MFLHGLVIFLDGIPFVYSYYYTLTAVMCNTCDLGILLSDSLGGVDHHDDHIGLFHRCHCTDNRKALQLLLYLALSAKSSGVDENVVLAVAFYPGIHCIPGGSGDIGNDEPVLTHQLIYQGGLAYVGLSDYGDPGDVVILLRTAALRKMGYDFVQKLSEAQLAGSGHRDGISQTQVVKLIHVGHELVEIVHLVHAEYHRLMGATEHVSHLVVSVHQSLLHIHHKDYHVRCLDGDHGLLPHL